MSMITNIEERIAEEVRKNPHLYNTPLKDYKDARMTANSAAVELDTLCFHLGVNRPTLIGNEWRRYPVC